MSFEKVDLNSLITGITPFAGFQNYLQVIKDPVFQRGVGTSLLFTVASVVFQFIAGFLLALLFSQYGVQWNDLMAVSVVAAIPAILVFFFAQRYLIAGLTVGMDK